MPKESAPKENFSSSSNEENPAAEKESLNVKNLILLIISGCAYWTITNVIYQSFQQIMSQDFITNQSETSLYFTYVAASDIIVAALCVSIVKIDSIWMKIDLVTLFYSINIFVNIGLFFNTSKLMFVVLMFIQFLLLGYNCVAIYLLVTDVCACSPVSSSYFWVTTCIVAFLFSYYPVVIEQGTEYGYILWFAFSIIGACAHYNINLQTTK